MSLLLLFSPRGAVANNGDLAATESGVDTAQFVAANGIDGALAATESGADTAQINATDGILAALTANETGSDTAQINGTDGILANLAATEIGQDTAAFAGPEAEIQDNVAGGGSPRRVRLRDHPIQPIPGVKPWIFDDQDMLEMMPIIVGLLNARR